MITMKNSLVQRIILLITVTVLVTFAGLGWVFYRSTSDVFVQTQNEEEFSRSIGSVEQFLKKEIEQAFSTGGWDAVRQWQKARDTAEEPENNPRQVFVIDKHDTVVAANSPMLRTASVTRLSKNEFSLSATCPSGDEVELLVEGGLSLYDPAGAQIGYLFALPLPIDEATGNQFAFEVGKSAAVSILVIISVAILATVAILRSSLRPMKELTSAAEQLQSGQIPPPIDRQGGSEFCALIDAFNSATQTMTRTETIRRQWIADVSHELRTPVTNIRAILEATQNGLITDENNVRTELQSEIQLLERLVADFQQLAQTDAGQLRFSCRPLNLKQALETSLMPTANVHHVELVVNVSDQLAVVADEDRLKQVLGNLLENSIQYYDAPTPLKFTVEVVAVGQIVSIRLADNGPGISPEDRDYVFDRFYRAEKSRSRRTGGAGLGLAICKAILHAMNGSIALVGSEHGTCFEITLPQPDSSDH